jgi:predicted O-methyltransferase YrrM
MVANRATTAIEIGVANGFSSQCLGRALSVVGNSGLLVSCDSVDFSLDLAKNLVYGLPIEHKTINGDSGLVVWADYLDGRPCDLAFIDGDHEYEPALLDIVNCSMVMADRGFMICHDYAGGQPGVVRAVDKFVAESIWNKMVFLEQSEYGDYGWAILHR